jgi:hypothetical protein
MDCRECSSRVSPSAEACPTCGAPINPRPPVTAGTIAVGVFLGMLAWTIAQWAFSLAWGVLYLRSVFR